MQEIDCRKRYVVTFDYAKNGSWYTKTEYQLFATDDEGMFRQLESQFGCVSNVQILFVGRLAK